MNWTPFALATYVFFLCILLMLAARQLFPRAGGSGAASADRTGLSADFALLERIARLTRQVEELQAAAQAPAAPDEEAEPAPGLARAPVAVRIPALTPDQAPALDFAQVRVPAADPVQKAAKWQLSAAPREPAEAPQGLPPPAPQEAVADPVQQVGALVRSGLDDASIAGRLRLSLAEVGLIRRLPPEPAAPATLAAETLVRSTPFPAAPTPAAPTPAAPAAPTPAAPEAAAPAPAPAAPAPAIPEAPVKRPRGRPRLDRTVAGPAKSPAKEIPGSNVMIDKRPALAEIPARTAGNGR